MDNLSPDQAQALWDAGGFLVLTDLPPGSEFGIDGTFHLTRRFSGIKFIPPGLHMITWSASPSAGQRHQPSNPGDTVSTDRPDLANIAGAGPAAIPIRSALLRIWNPRERVILSYDRQTESVPHSPSSVSGAPNDEEEPAQVISEDHLRTLDPEMAAYPWDGFPRWSGLTNLIPREVLSGVLGNGRVDAMTPVEGEVDEAARKGADRFTVPQTETGITEAVPPPATTEAGGARGGESGNPAAGTGSAPASALASLASASAEERAMRFAQFELKRSWAEGAVGEEVTKWSRDKSWLLGHVVTEQLEGDATVLVAQLQLAFVLLLYLSSWSALQAYKRLVTLLCQSPSFLTSPADLLHASADTPTKTSKTSSTSTSTPASGLRLARSSPSPTSSHQLVVKTYISLLETLSAQLDALPRGAFETELPEMDVFYLDQLESLRTGLVGGMESSTSTPPWSEEDKEGVRAAWGRLGELARKEWGWDLGELTSGAEASEDEEEEGEFAPVIVEM